MEILNAILNALGLLLWSLWLVRRGEAPRDRAASRWTIPAALGVLLALRCFFYWEIGTPLGWVFHLNLGTVSVPFSAESLLRMALYSPLSFFKSLFVFHAVLAAIALWGRPVPSGGAAGWMFLRLGLGFIRWPGWITWLAGMVVAMIFWLAAARLLQMAGLVPSLPVGELVLQAALIGVAATHLWLWTLAALLMVAAVNRHFYLGAHPVWVWLAATASNSLRWTAWIPVRFGGLDFRPLAGAGLAVALSILLQWLLERY
jgi:hypothetical protein